MNDYITLAEAAQRTVNRPSSQTIWRWARQGVMAPNGEYIRLEYRRIGHRLYTTMEWLEEFHRKVTEARDKHYGPRDDYVDFGKPRVPDHRTAEAQLRKAGVL